MAQRAILREPAGDVVGIGGLLKLCQVARNACRRKSDKDTTRVTTAATEPDVCAGQRECRLGVVKNSAQPVGGAVTDGAVRREPCRHMIGIGGLLEGG